MPLLQPRSSDSVFKSQPPPLWYVTNGDLTVGPVDTKLLIRGVEYGRVPEYCHVRAFTGDWRALLGVREIAALNGSVANGPSLEQLAEWGRFLQRVRDPDEFFHTATWLSMVVTGAETAMFHASARPGGTLFTRSILGPVSQRRMGLPLSEFDLSVRSARRGLPVQGPPYGLVEDTLAKRLATTQAPDALCAVAMIPLTQGGQLSGMLELARSGHAFRCSDLQRLERIVQRAVRTRPS